MSEQTSTAIVPSGHNEPAAPLSDGFVLDRTENPHPRMLTEAIAAADAAADAMAYWRGFLACMCAATGETPEAIRAWMERNR